ncbi:MAG: type III polyketide synthase [Egibacteraceae bacterium]
MRAAITGLGVAYPGVLRQDALWEGFFSEHYGRSPLAQRLWFRSGVRTRHGVVDPRDEDLSTWGTAARMRRFMAEAVPLGKAALSSCLADAVLKPQDVDLLAIVSCTGYATPGLDILLARDLGMRPDVQRLAVGHMGCYAALPGLVTVTDAAVARGQVAVLLCLELTSLHIQPATTDVDQIVSHALFSDAAAALVLTARDSGAGPGLEVVDVVARTDAPHAELMTWDVTDMGFRMGLSPDVPRVLDQHVAEVVGDLLAAHGLVVDDVAGWAIHPGGPRIVDVVARRLGLARAAVAASREVLRDHGNCSSATVLLILDRLRTDLRGGDPVVCLAFGPGLTIYAALLRVVER